MSVPTREDALRIIRDARARLDVLLERLDDSEITTTATLGGGDWSVKDLIGHLASWEERALLWLTAPDSAKETPYPSTDDFNAAEVSRKSGWSLDEVRDHARKTHADLIEALERLDEETWNSTISVPDRDPLTLGQIVGFILAGDVHGAFAHDLAHLADVEAYVESRS